MKKVLLLCSFVGSVLFLQAQTSLKLALDKGVQYACKVNSEQSIQQSYAGQQIAVKVKSYRSTSFRVVEKTAEGYQLEFCMDTINTSISAPGRNTETTSTVPGNTPVEKFMNRMSKLHLRAIIGFEGKFKSFVNYNAFKDSMFFVMDELPATQKDMARKQADIIVKESAIRSMIEPLFAYLPEKPVNMGDSWETTYLATSNDVSSVVINTISLKGVNASAAQLHCESTLEAMPSMDPNAAVQQDLKGKSSFDCEVDIKTGLSRNRLETGHFEGTVTAKQAGQELKIPMVIDSKSQMTFLSF